MFNEREVEIALARGERERERVTNPEREDEKMTLGGRKG